MDDAIRSLAIFPNYHSGFTFQWTLDPLLDVAPPWIFTVQESPTGRDAWADISPPLADQLIYIEEERRKFDKSRRPYFRIRGEIGGRMLYSAVRDAFGDLNRREWLLAREIMRKELLRMRGMGGVPVTLWMKFHTGAKCPRCRDVVSQETLDANCPVCCGTGYVTGFHGPYSSWASFTPVVSRKRHEEGGAGITDLRQHQVRLLGSFALVRDDLILDTPSQRVYAVDQISQLIELRRVPLVIQCTAHEGNFTDIAQSLSDKLLPATA